MSFAKKGHHTRVSPGLSLLRFKGEEDATEELRDSAAYGWIGLGAVASSTSSAAMASTSSGKETSNALGLLRRAILFRWSAV